MSLKGKILLIGLGVGIGYILGAKAGRERYDQIVKATDKVWNAPLVREGREAVGGFVDDRVGDLAKLLKTGASTVIDKATGRGRSRAKPIEPASYAPTESL
ncbi:MAG: YtxH domain-containing protein [Microbacteriaceae bacterium]|nr:YtxH domain-containing protein [Microbacteriaceae bacterium]